MSKFTPGFERPKKRQRLRFGNEHMVVDPLVEAAFGELGPDDKADSPEIAEAIKTKQITERSNAHRPPGEYVSSIINKHRRSCLKSSASYQLIRPPLPGR